MSKQQNKAKALEALLECNTLTEAAEKAGISRRTLYGYIRYEKDFATAYKTARERVQLEQLDQIAADRKRAQATIFEIMEDKEQPAAVRLKAAQSIIDSTAAAQASAEILAHNNCVAIRKANPLDCLFERE